MATAKTTTTRTRSTARATTKAHTKPASVDLDRVRKPFYAYVGVADLAVEKLRALPEVYTHGFNTAQAQVNHARGSFKTLPESVREQLQTLPKKAGESYADLVKRGHKLVTTVRNNPNAKAAVRQAKTARAQAKGAATSVRRSVSSVERVVEGTAAKVG
jgi:broad specificity phosphatase PhoE